MLLAVVKERIQRRAEEYDTAKALNIGFVGASYAFVRNSLKAMTYGATK
jgi:hypothetical protein